MALFGVDVDDGGEWAASPTVDAVVLGGVMALVVAIAARALLATGAGLTVVVVAKVVVAVAAAASNFAVVEAVD